jgi:hypothetical protein
MLSSARLPLIGADPELYGAAGLGAPPTPVLGTFRTAKPAIHTFPNADDWFLFS